jgi:catechol 2,3-dioxygenase-like lactoylglutathione lyase family enzyme
MAHSFHHVHIKSRDPRASAWWWADMFGAEVLPEVEFRAIDRDLARFEEQGLEIYERRPGAGGFEIAYVATPDGVCLELMHEVATS